MPKKILAVDDDKGVLEMISLRLERAGYEVVTASSGDEALEKVRAAKPDVVLLDIMLPGKHGFEVCQEIRADRSLDGIKVIFVSAKGFASDVKNSKLVGGDEYLVKPFDSKDLLAAIERVTASK